LNEQKPEKLSIDKILMEAEGQELDLAMTIWSDSFLYYQAQVVTLYEADRLANLDTVNELSNRE
jgi:hypothetical protein